MRWLTYRRVDTLWHCSCVRPYRLIRQGHGRRCELGRWKAIHRLQLDVCSAQCSQSEPPEYGQPYCCEDRKSCYHSSSDCFCVYDTLHDRWDIACCKWTSNTTHWDWTVWTHILLPSTGQVYLLPGELGQQMLRKALMMTFPWSQHPRHISSTILQRMTMNCGTDQLVHRWKSNKAVLFDNSLPHHNMIAAHINTAMDDGPQGRLGEVEKYWLGDVSLE